MLRLSYQRRHTLLWCSLLHCTGAGSSCCIFRRLIGILLELQLPKPLNCGVDVAATLDKNTGYNLPGAWCSSNNSQGFVPGAYEENRAETDARSVQQEIQEMTLQRQMQTKTLGCPEKERPQSTASNQVGKGEGGGGQGGDAA